MANTTTQQLFQGLLECARQFERLYPNTAFVPCFRSKDGRKPPCKGADSWTDRGLTANDLRDFSKMEMLGIVLADQFFVFDCDSQEAIAALDRLALTRVLPPTLEIRSGKEGRKGLVYKLPKPLMVRSKAPVQTLEYRTGKHYQIIAGAHPGGTVYKQNGLAIADLPPHWFDYLSDSDFLPDDDDLVILQQFLKDAIDYEFGSPDYYDSWLQIGMIIHDLNDTADGLELYIDWSKQSPRHGIDPDQVRRSCTDKWASFGKTENAVLTLGTLIYKLKEAKSYKKFPAEIDKILAPLEAIVQSNPAKHDIKSDFLIGGASESENAYLDAVKQTKKELGFVDSRRVSALVYGQQIQLDYPEELQLEHQAVIKRSLAIEELDVEDLIGDTAFGQLLLLYASTTGRPVDYLFMSFLTAYASYLPKGLSYRVDQELTTKPILFTVFVGDVASGKGLLTAPFTNPLIAVSKEQNNRYMDGLKDQQKRLDTYRKMPKADRHELYLQALGEFEGENVDLHTQLEVLCPEPSTPHFPFLAMVTPERLRSISGEMKKAGFLVAPDEIHALFAYMGKYSKDVGSNDLLLAWDGSTTQVNLQGEQYRTVDYYQFSLLSGIQGKRFSDIFNKEDPSGMLSRFLWLPLQKPVRLKLSSNPDDRGLDLTPHVLNLYETTQEIIRASWESPVIIEPTEAAKQLWIAWVEHQNKEADSYRDNHPGFTAWLSRNAQYTARIALVLHCFLVVEQNEPLARLSITTMEKAIKISSWLARKAQLVYEACEDTVDPIKAKIHTDLIKLAQNKYGGKLVFKVFCSNSFIKRQDVKSVYCLDADRRKEATRSLNKSEVRLLFQEMTALGLGVYNAEECSFKLKETEK